MKYREKIGNLLVDVAGVLLFVPFYVMLALMDRDIEKRERKASLDE